MAFQYWEETKNLFSTIIDSPPLVEKYLKRPPPKYIFSLIMKTMEKTGFPKGLFTQEEENINYFLDEINHKKQFLNKVIDITKLITNSNFDIEINNILKGIEPEKTNKFLQYFYKAATSNINAKPIIDKYLNDLKNKTNSNINKENKDNKTQNKIIEELKEKRKEIGYIFWIDKNVHNAENSKYYKSFKENSFYKQLHLQFYCFDNLEEPFDLIINYISFKLLFIIISGSLFPDYIHKLKEQIKFIRCIPICIIFTSENLKEIIIKRKIKSHFFKIYEDALYRINHPFYNLGGVSSDFDTCVNFIFNFYICLQNKFKLEEKGNTTYDGCITFEYIYSKNQLILPFLYNELMIKEEVPNNEIQLFINNLLINHREDKIVNLILPILLIKEIPHEIIIKYFLRIYTEQTSFYSEMNKLLMKQNGKYYKTFINVIYEGLLFKSISVSEDDYLYRGTRMTKNEIENIMKKFEEWRLKEDKSIPSFFLYSRCFLSFSKEEKQILKFIGKTDEKFYGIVFILKNNNNITNKYSSNADIEFLSAYTQEREVLFFPYSIFCLENIHKGEYKGIKCVIINLEYLGKYSNIFDNIKKDANFEKNLVDSFNNQNYSKEIIKSKIIEPNISDLNSAKQKIFEKIKNKINEKYNIEIKEEINEEKKIMDNMYVIEADEKNNVQDKKIKQEIMLDSDLINSIHEKYKIKENTRFFFLTSFKLEDMEYIWKGDYNEEYKKNGFGKEYDFDDNIVFEGEYINGIRKKGVEYYIIGTKKYEGEYKNGKRWNGILYDTNMEHQYMLKFGKGYIKEFHENGCISFEGDINNGVKTGKGKIYDEWGHLIFEGYLDNGIKNGIGKLYNFSGDLIFEGEFKDGEQFKGKKNIYNSQCELICTKENKKNKILFGFEDYYEIDIMIKNNIWIMKKKKNLEKIIYRNAFRDEKRYKGKEYNDEGELIFEGEYKDGEKYKGKDYNRKGELIFEGEYKDGKKYKGKEYNDYGEVIFEGEYKDGKKYKGKGKKYNRKGDLIYKGEYKDGKRYNGKGKEYNDEDILIYEGEYKDGKRYKGKGKEYNDGGLLIFEGEYKDGKRYIGKEYNDDRWNKLIFKGEYKDGKRYKGKEYNDEDILIYEGEYKDGKRYKGKGKEYNDGGLLIFEGEYKDGKRYIGKEYNDDWWHKLIFKGEYKDGQKYKGKEYNYHGELIFKGEYNI